MIRRFREMRDWPWTARAEGLAFWAAVILVLIVTGLVEGWGK